MTFFPVTSSTLSESELGRFIIEKYSLEKNSTCKLFRTGVNHTYFISNLTTKFVVRVYCHQWRSKKEIQEEIKLLDLLRNNNLSVSYPIPDNDGNLIQEVNAPEGTRYIVLFSYANGDKVRFMNEQTCFNIGELMGKVHKITTNKSIDRICYTNDILIKDSYNYLIRFFSEDLEEIKYIKKLSNRISKEFEDFHPTESQKGILHLDIWYDNLSVNADQITLFDFDNCGNGSFVYDLGYFCIQLFHIETDKKEYKSKVQKFMEGYKSIRPLSEKEIDLLPSAGASIFTFYLGIQAQRFDWSNIFFTENYIKMFIGRIKNWMDYNEEERI